MSVLGTVSLLFGTTKGQIDDITFDVIRRESYDLQNDVTDHPVEPGSGLGAQADQGSVSSVSDNVRRKPDVLTLDCVMSNTPVSILGVQLVKSVANLASAAATSNFLDAYKSVENGPAGEAFDKLCKLRDQGKLVNVATTFKTYQNMVITSVSIIKVPEDGSCLVASVTLKEVRLVSAQTVALPATPTGSKKVSKGPQPPKPPDPPKEEKSRSILTNLFNQ